MISFDEALHIIQSQKVKPGSERIRFASSAGRILLEDIRSDLDMPPFDKSAVDGYACRMDDIAIRVQNFEPARAQNIVPLRIIDMIPAGRIPQHEIIPGTCAKIMTGGMVPPGANCVVMVEESEEAGEGLVILKPRGDSRNICYRGEDIRKGDLVLSAGTRITPAHVAVLASVGAVNPLVALMPRAAVITTGDELVPPDRVPGPAQIRDSNSWQIEAQLKSLPVLSKNYGIVADEISSLRDVIRQALAENDLVLLTGGVSMGDFDHVPAILQEAGVEILFRSVAVQPGRPTVFGRNGHQFLFGLPGNPVSSFVIFETLVRPFLFQMMGHSYRPVLLRLPMGADYSRRNSSRLSLVPVVLRQGEIFPLEYHGSAHINAYTQAEGILEVSQGVTRINKGETAHVRLL